jgi:stage II sporulation protein D
MTADDVAPSPRIRAGLTTRADAVRLTSSSPFVVRSGSKWLVTHDVLVEGFADVGPEGVSHSIQVASFLSRTDARNFLQSLETDTDLSGRVRRESITGRYAVRVGSWSTQRGAQASIEGLMRQGYDALRLVAEPTSRKRPTSLILHPAGMRAIRSRQLSLLVLPAARGAWIEVDGDPYRGFIEIFVNSSNRLTVVNAANIEDYLRGVVPAELSPAVFPQLEAIKAQAVAARTYAVRHLGQYDAEGFDICTTPACQVYRGVGVEQPMSNEAVDATTGEVLVYDGELIDALYTSTCGGRTEDVQNVFSGDAQPYLVSRVCFVERPEIRLTADVERPLSWESAGAVVTGLVSEEEIRGIPIEESMTTSELSRWSARVMDRLGQTPCRTIDPGPEVVSAVGFAAAMSEALCWDGRLGFLLADWDMERLVPESEAENLSDKERRALGYWIQEQWLHPLAGGLRPGRPMSRREAMESLFRLIADRGEPVLFEATLAGARGDELFVEKGKEHEMLSLAAERYLFRRVGGRTVFAPALSLVPGDRFLYHEGDRGIDLMILRSHRMSFGSSSRFFRWTVRRTADELTRAVNAREALGKVQELRPMRYGKSGRVAELAIVGTDAAKTLKGLAIRRWLGVRENLFYIDRQVDESGKVSAWVFTGGGWGHGVGLCQVGAYGMAAAGHSYRDILTHYYSGTEILSSSRLVSDK